MQRMVGREAAPDLEVGDHLGVDRLGERDALVPPLNAARHPSDHHHRMLRRLDQGGRLVDQLGRGRRLRVRHVARDIDRSERLGELRLLHLRVEIDVDGAHGRGIGHPGPAQQGFARRRRGGRLVVPFRIVAYDRALIAGGVDPVDPRAALGSVDRAGRAQDDDGRAVAPGVEHRHGGVKQPDVGMHRRRHRLVGHLGVAVGDRDRGFLMQAEQHLRHLVAEIVDDRVVQPAVARSWIERDIGDLQRPQRIGHHVAAPGRCVCRRQVDRPIKLPNGRMRLGGRGLFVGRSGFGVCSRHEMILGL